MDNFELHFRVFSKVPVPSVIPRMTIEEHRVFVEGLLDGKVFTSMHIHEVDKAEGDLPIIFCPLSDGSLLSASPEFMQEIGVVWEFTKDRLSKPKKGSKTDTVYPTFSSMHICSKFDWDLACDVVKAMKNQPSLIT
jgi:hypothetical protein